MKIGKGAAFRWVQVVCDGRVCGFLQTGFRRKMREAGNECPRHPIYPERRIHLVELLDRRGIYGWLLSTPPLARW